MLFEFPMTAELYPSYTQAILRYQLVES